MRKSWRQFLYCWVAFISVLCDTFSMSILYAKIIEMPTNIFQMFLHFAFHI